MVADGILIGFRSFGDDGKVFGGNYSGDYLDTGGGLRPDLTGKGMGAELILKGLEFGSALYETDKFRVTVAAFNERALKVCKRIGFEERHRFHRPSDKREFVILTLEGIPR